MLSYRAFYQHKEEVRNHVDAKSDNIIKSIENWNIKNENCSIRIDTIYARLEALDNKHEQGNREIWARADQIERRLLDKLSQLREELLVLQTTSDMLKKAGLRGSDDTYQKQGRDE